MFGIYDSDVEKVYGRFDTREAADDALDTYVEAQEEKTDSDDWDEDEFREGFSVVELEDRLPE